MSPNESTAPSIVLNPQKFKGQVAVVTGSAQGIGQVVATLFAEQGASVVLVDLNKEKLEQVEQALVAKGLAASHRVCDLTSESHVHETINKIVQTLGKIEILAHIAGIYPAKPLLDVSAAEYRKIFQVNMDSTSVGKVLVQVGPGPIGPDFWVQVLGFWQGPVWTQKVLAKFVARRKKRIFFRTCESRFISISYTKCLPILWKVSNLSPLHWLNCQHPLLLHPLPHPILVIYRIDCKFEGLMEFNGF